MSVVPGHEHKIFIPYTKVFQPLDSPSNTKDNVLVHGSLTSLSFSSSHEGKLPLGRGVARYSPLNLKNEENGNLNEEIAFDFLVYGLGSQLPPPINLWSTPASIKADTKLEPKIPKSASISDVDQVYRQEVTIPQTRGTKESGMRWLKESQEQIRDAESVLVIGAGALGVREFCKKEVEIDVRLND